ncbi:MAG: NAD(P)H-hydrate dehydratase [Bacteroidales bacterium]|jgi:NAD(P)H-hydrate epimerase|nr:NAD(P)H-hydrate dehydratase [Bacteroidales bacterium]
MKIFRTDQIKRIDELTILNEPVRSVDLMERAAEQLLRWIVRNFDRTRRMLVFTGPGNNGGDGLALARLLSANRFVAEVFNVKISDKTSDDWNFNYQRLINETPVIFNSLENSEQFPFVGHDDIIIDAIFGSGLTRPVTGLASEIIKKINHSGSVVVSVDIPSGLFGEDNSANDPDSIVKAGYTLSFEFPKLSFMFPENARYTGEWTILPIGLHKGAVMSAETPYYFIEEDFVSSLLKKRQKFDHKGKFGHGLLVAGSYGRIGAAVLSAKAALKTGMGLLTCHVPGCGYQILQSTVPEAMVRTDKDDSKVTEIGGTDIYDSLGIGPGIGTGEETQKALHSFLLNRNKPIVIDADGLNILGMNSKWLSALSENCVLTPHLKEFDRIAGNSGNSYARLERQIEFSSRYNCVVLLKGAYSSVVTPDGKVSFNSTGNPGMATAGSGDVLTGIILSLLAQGYQPGTAAIVGAYLHGLAGDIAASETGMEALTASDIIENIGNAFLKLKNIVSL